MKPTGAKPRLTNLDSLRRRSVNLSPQEMVRQSFVLPGRTLPLILEPAAERVDLVSWAEAGREFLDAALSHHGAILFRGFNVRSARDFERFIVAASGEALEYRERSSPRSSVGGHIYTSTDYPADQSIFLHNENSYAHAWPLKLFFYCETPPARGGETPLADVRKVYARLAPEVREEFARKGVLYVRNFGSAVGLRWQAVFQTEDPEEVNAYCRERGYAVEWRGDQRLRTRRAGQAVARHPKTGEMVWFNHAAFFHVSTMGGAVSSALLAQFAEEDLPNNTYYGDGSRIEPAVLDALREAYLAEAVSFPWRRGDVLMLDNMLTAHGRAPFEGPRKILVGMSEPFDRRQLHGTGVS